MNRNKDKPGIIIIIGLICILLLIAFVFKSCAEGEGIIIFNLSQSNPKIDSEDMFSVIIAWVFNIVVVIILAILIGRAINKGIRKKSNELQKETIKEIEDEINRKQKTIDAVLNFEKGLSRTNRLLSLLSCTGGNSGDNLKSYFDTYIDREFQRILPVITSKLALFDRSSFPTTYYEYQNYCRKLRSEIVQLQDKKHDIESCTNHHEFEKMIGKGYKRPIRITIAILICVSIIGGTIAIVLYNSTSFTISLAQNDFRKSFSISNIVEEDTQIRLDNVRINLENEDDVYISNYSKEVDYEFSFIADCNDISKYYTTDKNSAEAKRLQTILKSIYNSIDSHTYTYNHSNGWKVGFKFYGTFVIQDSDGHKYEYIDYLHIEDLATIVVDGYKID